VVRIPVRCLQALILGVVLVDASRADVEPARHPRGATTSLSTRRLEDETVTKRLDPGEFGDRVATRAAIARGLRFLAKQQAGQSDGSVPSVGSQPARLAVTALGALAYMSAGNTLGRGPHGAELTRAVDYLLTHTELDPTTSRRGYISDAADPNSRMHAHGFAALALAEAYGTSPRSDRGARIAESLQAAIAIMESSQTSEGGWFYDPVRGVEHEGSVTIALVQAMRAAKNCGLRVQPETITKAVDYVRRSQADSGAFRYAIGNDQVTVALTAAAISTLNATGRYHGSEIQQGFDYIDRELRLRAESPKRDSKLLPPGSLIPFPYYERLYLAQAYWQSPDRTRFDRWYEAESEALLRTQAEDGSWSDPRFGPTYATAINILVLALPDQLLPIFQR